MRSSLFFGCHAAESLLRCIDRRPTSIHYLPYYKMYAGVDECKGRGETGGMARKYVASARKNATNATYFAWIATDLARPSSNQGDFPTNKTEKRPQRDGWRRRGRTGDERGTNGGFGAWSRVKICTKNRRPCVLSHVVMGRKAAGWLSKTMARTTRRRRRRSASCPCCGRVRQAPRGCIRPRSAGQRAAKACRAAGRGR